MQQYIKFDLINSYSNNRLLYTEQIALHNELASRLKLEIKNVSDKDITLKQINGTPDKENHHFRLFFPANILSKYSFNHYKAAASDSLTTSILQKGLMPNTYQLFLICKQSEWKAGGILTINLDNFLAADQNSTTNRMVHLEGCNLQNADQPISNDALKVTSELTIKNNLINRLLPLHFTFEDHDTVLNNDAIGSDLTLLAINMATVADKSLADAENIVFTTDSRVSVSFDIELSNNSRPSALAKEGSVSDTHVTFPDGWVQDSESVIDATGKIGWTFKPSEKTTLTSLSKLVVQITGIKTDLPAGYASIYFSYQDVPNYGSGQFAIPVLKTPLITRGHQVGIGLKPSTTLDIGGKGTDNIELTVNGRIMSKGTSGGMWLDADRRTFIGSNGDNGIRLYLDNDDCLTVDKSGNTTIARQLTVDGESTLNKSLVVKENLTVDKNLSVEENVTINGKLAIGDSGDDTIELTVDGRLMSKGKSPGMWFGEDKSMFIGAYDNTTLALWNNNAFRMTIQNNGNINMSNDLSVAGKLTTNSDLTFNGRLLHQNKAPIEAQSFVLKLGEGIQYAKHEDKPKQLRYSVGSVCATTNRHASDYVGIVAGYNILNWDVYEHNRSAFSIRIAPDTVGNGILWVFVDLPVDQWNVKPLTQITVDCVFINKALVQSFS